MKGDRPQHVSRRAHRAIVLHRRRDRACAVIPPRPRELATGCHEPGWLAKGPSRRSPLTTAEPSACVVVALITSRDAIDRAGVSRGCHGDWDRAGRGASVGGGQKNCALTDLRDAVHGDCSLIHQNLPTLVKQPDRHDHVGHAGLVLEVEERGSARGGRALLVVTAPPMLTRARGRRAAGRRGWRRYWLGWRSAVMPVAHRPPTSARTSSFPAARARRGRGRGRGCVRRRSWLRRRRPTPRRGGRVRGR